MTMKHRVTKQKNVLLLLRTQYTCVSNNTLVIFIIGLWHSLNVKGKIGSGKSIILLDQNQNGFSFSL